MIITTRINSVAKNTERFSIDVLAQEEARKCLAKYIGIESENLPPIGDQIIEKCGELPVALAAVGSMIGRRVKSGNSQEDIGLFESTLKKLTDANIEKIKIDFEQYPDCDTLLRVIQISVEDLEEAWQNLYMDFAVFPEDNLIPDEALFNLWKSRGHDQCYVSDILAEMDDRSLIIYENLNGKNHYKLHDIYYDYVRNQSVRTEMKVEDIPNLHKRLINSYRLHLKERDNFATGPDDGYYYQYLPYHMKESEMLDELRLLLLAFDWLYWKLIRTNIPSLINDYDLYLHKCPDDRALKLVRDSIQLSSHILGKDKHQLASQLIGRLLAFENDKDKKYEVIRSFLENVREGMDRLVSSSECPYSAWFCPMSCCFEAPGGALIRTLIGHEKSVEAVAITPDGKKVVSASTDYSLKVWDIESGIEIWNLIGHTLGVKAVSITPKGEKAVSASDDCTLKVWDLCSGKEVWTLKGHTRGVKAIAITPDNEEVVSATEDGTLKVWDFNSGKEIWTLKGDIYGILAVAITPDGKKAVTPSRDSKIMIWDLEKRKEIGIFTGHSSRVQAVAITPDGEKVVSASYDKTIKIWDLEKGKEIGTLTGHTGRVQTIVITPDGKKVVSASYDGTLRLWDLISVQEKVVHAIHLFRLATVAITSDKKRVVSEVNGHTLKIWDLESGKELWTLTGSTYGIFAVAITSDGRTAVSTSRDGKIKIWDLNSGKELRAIRDFCKLSITPNGEKIVLVSFDDTITIMDLSSGQKKVIPNGHIDRINAVAITPDRKIVISASEDETIKIWDLRNGTEIGTLRGHKGGVDALAITSEGKKVVSASKDCTLKVWDLCSKKDELTLTGHTDYVYAVSITPDGKKAVSESADQTFRIWNLSNGKELWILPRYTYMDCDDIAKSLTSENAMSAYKNTIVCMDLNNIGKIKARFIAEERLIFVRKEDNHILTLGINLGIKTLLSLRP